MKLFDTVDFKNKITTYEEFKMSFSGADVVDRFKDKIRENADRAAKETIPILPALYYRDFVLNGNRTRYEGPYFERRINFMHLMLGEFTFGSGEYIDALIDIIWAICEETTWKLPAHNNHSGTTKAMPQDRQLPFEYEDDVFFVDLFSAQTGAMIALALYLFEEKLESACPDTVVRRMKYELNRQILHPFERNYKEYWWSGMSGNYVNNWNPWIASNVLAVVAFTETDAHKRESFTEALCHVIDNYIKQIPSDGSCDEGAGYWGVSLGAVMNFIEMLSEISGGKITVTDNEILRKACEYIVKMHITSDNEFVTFNDCARYNRPDYAMIYRCGKLMNSRKLCDFAAHYAPKYFSIKSNPSLPYSLLKYFVTDMTDNGFVHDDFYYMDKIQIMTARNVFHGNNVFVCAKAGANNEGHGHLDVGVFVLYINDHPVFLDPGVPSYTKDTFNENRFKAWAMRSPYHSTPDVDGIEQAPGAKFKAESVVCSEKVLELEMKDTLSDSSGINSLHRTVNAKDGFCVTDSFDFEKERTYRFNLFSAVKPEITGNGELTFRLSDSEIYSFEFSSGYKVEYEYVEESKNSRLVSAWNTDTFIRTMFSIKAKSGSFTLKLK